MKNPLISVIIPCYNRTNLLKEAVISVCKQSFTNFELIIVDDCSEEDIEKAISELQDEAVSLPPLRFISLKKHSGMPGYVRNRGVDVANGEFIAFLDSDDLWERDKLEKQIAVMLEREGQLCHTREKWVRQGKIISQSSQKHKREGDIFEDALWKCIIGPSTVMMKKSLFEKYRGFWERIEVAEDYELWLRVTSENLVLYIDEPLTIKRAGDWDQLSEKYGQIEIFRIKAIKNLLENQFFSSMAEKEALAKDMFAKKCTIYATGCHKRGKDDEAVYYEKLALQG